MDKQMHEYSTEKMTRPECSDGSKAYIGEAVAPGLIGRNVVFAPPQECKGPNGPEIYAAIVTKVNGKSQEHGQVETVSLVTFGPNSVYFQHNVPYSARRKPGHWAHI